MKKALFFFLLFVGFLSLNLTVFAQEATPTPTTSVTPTPEENGEKKEELEKKIAELESKVAEAQAQGKTLSSQITVMDSQTRLTQLRINSTQAEITKLTKDIEVATDKIDHLEEALTNITKALLNRIVATYQQGTVPPVHLLVAASDAKDLIRRANYIKLAQEHDKKLIYDTQQAKTDYQNQKDIFEQKKKKVESLKSQLVAYTNQLEQEKKSKQVLLSVTKNDEAKYQALLKEARAQISGFKSFATSQSGSGVLPPQASPDGWYYNQRDSRWGNNNIGASGEKVWEVGCLLTSMAMVLKQSGQSITPSEVAATNSYFFSDTAYMLIPWGGGRFTSIWSKDLGSIDSKLAAGKPVIIGVKAGPYGTHFIVFKSGSNGNYVMNDPWYGANLNFSDHYSTGQIFQYGYLN